MRWFIALVLGLLAIAAAAQAPRPVRPSLESAWSHTAPLVRLQQDSCFTWSTPVVARAGNTFTITQDVSPGSGCSGGQGARTIPIERVPVGTYRLDYRANAIGMAPIPDYSLEFSVNEFVSGARALRIFPVRPNALEPVVARFSIDDGCELATGMRVVAGGFVIPLRRIASGVACDAGAEASLTIGAFAPGPYFVALEREEDGVEIGRTSFTVSGTTPGPFVSFWTDLSGLWTAADEEPNTAIAIVHTLDRAPNGLLRDALVGIWYTYDAAGAPVWLYIEANSDGGYNAGRMSGTIQFRIFAEDFPATITGTLDGRPFDIRIERFRFTRSAWPPPRNSPP
jgi:hypothetical protein